MLRSEWWMWIAATTVFLLAVLRSNAEPAWSISSDITDQRGLTFGSNPGVYAGVRLTPAGIGVSMGNQSFSAVEIRLFYSAMSGTTDLPTYQLTPFYTTVRLDVTDYESGQTQSRYFTGIFNGSIQMPQTTGEGWGVANFVWTGGNQHSISFGDRSYIIDLNGPVFPAALASYENDYSSDWLGTASIRADVTVYATPEPSTLILAIGAMLCLLVWRRRPLRVVSTC